MAGAWRRLRNEELRNLYISPNIIGVIKIRGMRWVGHVVRVVVMNTYSILVEKRKGTRPCGRPRRRWEENIIMGIRETV
jgi:hypothetical protein